MSLHRFVTDLPRGSLTATAAEGKIIQAMNGIKNILMDMDGVLVRGRTPIPGANELIDRLNTDSVPYLVLTNNPLYTPGDLAHRLQTGGLNIPAERIFTSAMATARFIQSQKPDGKAYVIGKGGKKCCLRFGKRSVAAITDYLYARITFPVLLAISDKPMFISHSRNTNGKRISTVTAHNAIKDAVEELGLDESISAHDIRHYRATQLINSGVPLHIIQTLLNHGSIEITRKYYAVVDSDESVDNYLSKVNHYGEVTHEA